MIKTVATPLSAPIDWLFIDVGGVLLDDTPLLNALYRFFAEWLQRHQHEVTLDQLLATRDRLTEQGENQVYKKVLAAHASGAATAEQALLDFRAWLKPRQYDLNPLIPGVRETLPILAQHWNLALAANQGSYIHEILEKHGIRHYFKQAFIAGELGVSKPNDRFFETMLTSTGCSPGRAVMIGDSMPNDIIPAIQHGMRAVYVSVDSQNSNVQKSGSITPDATISSLAGAPALFTSGL